MRLLSQTPIPDGWPVLVGVVGIGVSCALMKTPPDLTAETDVGDILQLGAFSEPDGTVTEGGTVSGSWSGDCDIYGYPYNVELTLVDAGGTVSGDGSWYTGWGTFDGTVDGTRTADGIQITLDVDYYGYPLAMYMDAEFSDGVTLVGDCEISYGSRGSLRLERD
jgi:hypothetical protein